MTWKEALDEYFLKHETLNQENRAWLIQNVLLNADLIREMDRQQILDTFTRNGKLNNTLLVMTLVWQCLGLILCGREDPLMGNIRSFWYKFADPVFVKNKLYDHLRDDRAFRAFLEQVIVRNQRLLDRASITRAKKGYIQNLCEDVIQAYVENKVFRYQGPFQFANHNAGAGLIGSRASLLFFVEKEGLKKKYCERYFQKYGISVLWSEGQPSLLTCEYFGDQLQAKKVRRIAFGGLVDYDPPGYAIARTYRRHFEKLGFETKGFTILTTPEVFTDRALAEDSEDLDTAYPHSKTMNDAWFEQTKGIHGKRRCIHVNHAMMSRVDKAVEAWYQSAIEL